MEKNKELIKIGRNIFITIIGFMLGLFVPYNLVQNVSRICFGWGYTSYDVCDLQIMARKKSHLNLMG